jgi:hypothetical protein
MVRRETAVERFLPFVRRAGNCAGLIVALSVNMLPDTAGAAEIWITQWTPCQSCKPLPQIDPGGVRAIFLADGRWKAEPRTGGPIYLEDNEIVFFSETAPSVAGAAVMTDAGRGKRFQVRSTDRPSVDEEIQTDHQ